MLYGDGATNKPSYERPSVGSLRLYVCGQQPFAFGKHPHSFNTLPYMVNVLTNYITGLEFKQYAFRPMLHVLRQMAMGATEPQEALSWKW